MPDDENFDRSAPGRTVRQLTAAIRSGDWHLDPSVDLDADTAGMLLDGPLRIPRRLREAHLMTMPHEMLIEVTPAQATAWLATRTPEPAYLTMPVATFARMFGPKL